MTNSRQGNTLKAVQGYLDNAPKDIGDRAILIADTAQLMRYLLADSLGIKPNDVPVDVAVNAAIAAVQGDRPVTSDDSPK